MNRPAMLVYYLYSIFELLFGIKPVGLVLRIFLRMKIKKDRIIQMRRAKVKLKVRGAMDVWSVKETFLDKFYEKHGTKVNDGWVVVDVGAAIGEFTLFAACNFPNNRVLGFEPFPQSFALLNENLALNGVKNVSVYNEAIWSSNGRLTLDLTPGEPLQLISQDEEKTSAESLHVPAYTLEKVMAREGLPQIDLLKMDCEGAEFEILLNCHAETLSKIKRIVMEYHDGYEKHHHAELVTFLQSAGYQVKVKINPVHTDLGYLYAELP